MLSWPLRGQTSRSSASLLAVVVGSFLSADAYGSCCSAMDDKSGEISTTSSAGDFNCSGPLIKSGRVTGCMWLFIK